MASRVKIRVGLWVTQSHEVATREDNIFSLVQIDSENCTRRNERKSWATLFLVAVSGFRFGSQKFFIFCVSFLFGGWTGWVGFGAAGSISHACRKKLNLHGFMYRIWKRVETSTGKVPIWRTQFWKRLLKWELQKFLRFYDLSWKILW